MPPEVIMSQQYSKKSDVWSYGCTVLQMASGSPPFSQFSNHVAALIHITQAEHPPPIPAKLSDDCRNFIELCLQRTVARRPYVSELLLHPFVGNGAKAHDATGKEVSSSSASPRGQDLLLPATVQTTKPGGPEIVPGFSPRSGHSQGSAFPVEAHEEDERHYRKFRLESLQRISVPIRRETQRRSALVAGWNIVPVPAAVPTRLPESFNPTRDRLERSAAIHTSAVIGSSIASAASLAPTESGEHIGVAAAATSSGSAAAVAVVTVLQCSGHARAVGGGSERGPPHVYCTARLGVAEYRSRAAAGEASWEPRLDEVFVFALPVADGDDGAARSAAAGEEAEWVDIRVLDAHPADPERAELGRARVPVPKPGAGPVEAWYPLVLAGAADSDGGRGNVRRPGSARSQEAGRILVRASRAQVRSARRGHANVQVDPAADAAVSGVLSTPTRMFQQTECVGSAGVLPGAGSISNRPAGIGTPRRSLPSPPPPSPTAGRVSGVPAAVRAQQTPSPPPAACDSDEGCDGEGGGGWAGQLVRPPRMSSAPARPRNR